MFLFAKCLFFALCSVLHNTDARSIKHKSNRAHQRVINGLASDIVNWPFVAKLSFHREDAPYKICGGALIHEKFVLTAAHCTTATKGDPITVAQPQDITVGLGRLESSDAPGENNYTLSRIIQYPLYKENKIKEKNNLTRGLLSFDYDLALLELSEPAKLGENVQIVKIRDESCGDEEDTSETETQDQLSKKPAPEPGFGDTTKADASDQSEASATPDVDEPPPSQEQDKKKPSPGSLAPTVESQPGASTTKKVSPVPVNETQTESSQEEPEDVPQPGDTDAADDSLPESSKAKETKDEPLSSDPAPNVDSQPGTTPEDEPEDQLEGSAALADEDSAQDTEEGSGGPSKSPFIEDPIYENCEMAGWGSEARFASPEDFAAGEYTPAENLKKMDVKVVTLGTLDDRSVLSRVLFGVYKEAKSQVCLGDSGSPMVCTKNGKRYLDGVTVAVNPWCDPDYFPAVYTKVASYSSWIESVIYARESAPSTERGPGDDDDPPGGSAEEDDVPEEF